MSRLKVILVSAVIFLAYCPKTILADQFQDLIRQINTPDPIKKCEIIKKLGDLKDENAVPYLLKILKDSSKPADPKVISPGLKAFEEAKHSVAGGRQPDEYNSRTDLKRYKDCINVLQRGGHFDKPKAIQTLGMLGNPQAIKPLYDLIGNLSFRKDVITAMRFIGGYDTVLYLNKALLEGDTFTRSDADSALKKLGFYHGLDPLLDLLKSSDSQARIAAARALLALDDSSIQSELKKAIAAMSKDDQDEINGTIQGNIKLTTIKALGFAQNNSVIRPLKKELLNAENDREIRLAAGRVLGNHKNSTIVKTIEKELFSSNKSRNVAGMSALGYIGNNDAVNAIYKAIQNNFLKKNAIEALANTNNPKAVNILASMLEDHTLKDSALNALLKIEDPSAIKLLVKMLDSADVFFKRDILEAIIKMNKPSMIPYMAMALKDHVLADDAVKALLKFDDPAIIEPLSELFKLRRGNPRLKREVFARFIKMDDPRVLPALGAAVTDRSLKDEAFDALVEINKRSSGDPAMVKPMAEAMVNALSTTDKSIRSKALSILVSLRDPSVIGAIVDVLKEDRFMSRIDGKDVSNAIERLGTPKHADKVAELLEVASVRKYAAKLLIKWKWKPKTNFDKVSFYIASGQWNKCKKMGKLLAMDILLDELKNNNTTEAAKILARWQCHEAREYLIGCLRDWRLKTELIAILEPFYKWTPKTTEDKIAVAISGRQKGEFKKLWKSNSSVRAHFKNIISSGTHRQGSRVVTMSIAYGLVEMIDPMINRLKPLPKGSEGQRLANQLMASGNEKLLSAGKQWCKGKYELRKTRGNNSWGSR